MPRIELIYDEVEEAIVDFLKKKHGWDIHPDQIQCGMDAETVEVSEYVYKKNKEGREVVDHKKTEKNTHKETMFLNGYSKVSFYIEEKADENL